ncbi:BlaI/MecI/CopY family transcriptional regulator [Prauserella oleivorans]|uniref:Penicillinase repressor n=2 Tax=Prauserella TaxID=142577 RepID=A0A2V4B2M3_9PSEU|nr:BlaI/MecI/CopY family transcriptional regulator [Prauserella muralis]PXY28277.1 penicillinase repressor [Prauserella muralis]TWE27458.1 putative transcriptional regulator [Prauserella muralis]
MFGLGDLEGAVMEVLWRADEPVKVRQVLENLSSGRKLAYTTVMTVLDNLHRKGWAHRDRDGKAYRYRPAFTREEAAVRALREALDASGNPRAALLHFANSASARETEILRTALAKKVRRQ